MSTNEAITTGQPTEFGAVPNRRGRPAGVGNAGYKDFYNQNGYLVVAELFSPEEVAFYRDHYMRLREAGTYYGDFAGVNLTSDDPLARYPRMIHMHRWDEASLQFLLEPRLNHYLTALLDDEPLACQTMIYFKPPKARGQALHQDNYYLRTAPGTCMAAWLALDETTVENGCLQMVPGSHKWDILCVKASDTTQSLTEIEVPLPDHLKPIPIEMQAGDVIFFHGALAHGSFPNRTTDRFRRSLIGHYVQNISHQVVAYDQPVLRMDGTVAELEPSPLGGACGVWVDKAGQLEIEQSGYQQLGTTTRE